MNYISLKEYSFSYDNESRLNLFNKLKTHFTKDYSR